MFREVSDMSFFTAVYMIRRIANIPRKINERYEQQKLSENLHVIRLCEIAVESVKLIETTYSPKTFFGRYDDLERCLKEIRESRVRTKEIQLLTMELQKIVRRKTRYINELIDRCLGERLHEILKYRDKMTDKSYRYLLYWLEENRIS